jgi:hypothetical protein
MVVVLVNFLTATYSKEIHPATAATVAAKKRKLSSQNLTEAGSERAGLFLNALVQILMERTNSDTVQKPAFSGVPGINKNFHIC